MLGREPVLWIALINSLIMLAIGFGLKLTTEQVTLIMAAVNAILAFVARSQVTPNAKS